MSSPWPGGQVRRAARTIRPHSRRVVVASQPGSAAGSRIRPVWCTSCSQTASAPSSRYRRQIDHTSRAYRSTIASHARWSPSCASITRSVTGASLGFGPASAVMIVISFPRTRPPARPAVGTGNPRQAPASPGRPASGHRGIGCCEGCAPSSTDGLCSRRGRRCPCLGHGSGGAGHRAPPRDPCPVGEHRQHGSHQGGPGGDQGDLPAGHAASDNGVDWDRR